MEIIFVFSPKRLSAVAFQFIWYDEYIKIGNSTIYYCYFTQKIPNHIGDFFENDSKMRSWEDLRAKLGLDNNKRFYWGINYLHNPSCLERNVFIVW